ncbi:hypothetical protein OAP76_00675 [Alphaproteobacteria bacterium]|nr:hypothetical protein [Alphaproteobacteria bacterium]
MASIFDYYGSMRKGMKDREKEVEATILARQDAMYKHLERFPTLDDESIDAYASQFGIGGNFTNAVKKQRDQNVFVQDEKNTQLQQATTSGDLDIISKEISNDQADLNFQFSEQTFDNKVALSDLDVKAKGVNLDQSILNLKESEFDFGEKRKQSALVFRKLQLDVEGKSISNDQAKQTLLENKALFPYELQKTIQQLEKGEIEIDQALQTLTQDALLFDHTLESKRLTNIKSKEDIINQYREYNYNATPEEVEEFLKQLDVNPSRALDILAYHKIKKDKEDQDIFLKTMEVQQQQATLYSKLYQDALKANGYNHELAVQSVMNSVTANPRSTKDIIAGAEAELAKFNQTGADKAKNAEAMTVINSISPTASMSVVKQNLEKQGVNPELAKAVLAEHEARLQQAFIKDVNTNRGLLESFLQADEEETRRLLSEVYGFDAEDMSVQELDFLKQIVYENKTYGDMKDKSVLETAGNTITNNTKDMTNYIVATSADYSQRDLPILQMINQKYYIRPEDIPKITSELGLIDGDSSTAFALWEQQHGNTEEYQTQTQFRTTFVDGLTDSDKPVYLDKDNNPIDTTSDDGQTTEAGLSSMKNHLDEQISMIVNGKETGIDKTNKLLKLQEELTKYLEKMDKNISRPNNPDKQIEQELVEQMKAQIDRIVNNQIELLQSEVEVEKEEKQNTFKNTDTFTLINENIDSIITETLDGRGFFTGNDESRFKKILTKKLKEYNIKNGTNVTEEALINSLKKSGNYPDFDGGMIR